MFRLWRKNKRNIAIDVGKPRSVVVNGHVFVCRISDIDVMEYLMTLQRELDKLQPEQTDEILAHTRRMVGLIDKMLGDGAAVKVFDGQPVSLHDAVGVVGEIAVQVIAVHNDAAELCTAQGKSPAAAAAPSLPKRVREKAV